MKKENDILEDKELDSSEIDSAQEVTEEVVSEETTEEVVSEESVDEETETEETTDEVVSDESVEEDEEELEEETTQTSKRITKDDLNIQEHIDAMLSGQELSEEFKEKATTIFEAAVLEKINEHIEILEQEYEENLEENLQGIRLEITEKVDEYLTYVAKEWIEENKVQVENQLKMEIMEKFMTQLKTVFEENYIDMPEEKVDLYKEAVQSAEVAEQKLNEQIEKNVKLQKQLDESQREVILKDVTEELTATQSEKIRSLCEGVEFVNADDFRSKTLIIKENYFPSENVSESTVIAEETETSVEDSPVVMKEESEKTSGVKTNMDIYLETIKRFTKK